MRRPTFSARPSHCPLTHLIATLALTLASAAVGCGEPPADPEAAGEPGAALGDAGLGDGGLPSALPEAVEPPPEMPPVPTIEDDPCQAGATRCLDEAVAQRCLRDGTWADIPCERGQACVDGPDRCLPVECEPQKSRCDGRWAEQRCAADGSSWSLGSACSPDEQCVGGVCRVCVPNAGECTSNATRRICNGDGSAWLPDEVCPTGLCLEGQCLVCVPREGQCLDEMTARVCRADGMGLEPEPETCAEGTTCRGGRCRPPCTTPILLLVDDSAPMAPYTRALQGVLEQLFADGSYDLALMSARASNACGGGVAPPPVRFGDGAQAALDWIAGMQAEGTSQVTDIMVWLQQNRDLVWGDDEGHVIILTASGDVCGPEGNPGRVNWNQSTYEGLGGRLRQSGVRLNIINVGGGMDRQLDRLGICNGTGPAIDLDDAGRIVEDLRTTLTAMLAEGDICR